MVTTVITWCANNSIQLLLMSPKLWFKKRPLSRSFSCYPDMVIANSCDFSPSMLLSVNRTASKRICYIAAFNLFTIIWSVQDRNDHGPLSLSHLQWPIITPTPLSQKRESSPSAVFKNLVLSRSPKERKRKIERMKREYLPFVAEYIRYPLSKSGCK